VVAFIPRGPKTRSRIASSYAAPRSFFGWATYPATYPAAAASRFEYWNVSPNFVVGCTVASRSIVLFGVAFLNSNSHSRSCLGRPVHAQMRCLIITLLVVSASPSRKPG
jgi:hypothetical protein